MSVAAQTAAAIVYYPVADPPLVTSFPNYLTQEIDVDGNGTIDVAIEPEYPWGGLGAAISAPGPSAVFGIDYPPPSNDLGFIAIALVFGEEIGPLLSANYGPLAAFYSNETIDGRGLLAGTDGFGGHIFGDFAHTRAYGGIAIRDRWGAALRVAGS